jgi:two-component system, chemotaxis family, chemotaxis protein CheY
MKVLIAEDDLMCASILLEFLQPFGKCEIATTGKQAIEMFKMALDRKDPYDLICLDILLPELNGHQVREQISNIEKNSYIPYDKGAKIFITSALEDYSNVIQAFQSQCEAYFVKPLKIEKLVGTLKQFGLITENEAKNRLC